MGAFREVGAAFVRLFVKKDELSAGLKQAEAEVKGSADRMNSGIGGVGRGIRDWARPVKTFQSAITSTLGIVTSLLGTFTLIGGAIGLAVAGIVSLATGASKARKEMEEFHRSAREASKAVIDAGRVPTGGEATKSQRELQDILIENGKKIEEIEAKIRQARKFVDQQIQEINNRRLSSGIGPMLDTAEAAERARLNRATGLNRLEDDLRAARGANASLASPESRAINETLKRWAEDDAKGNDPTTRQALYYVRLIAESARRQEESLRTVRQQLGATTNTADQRAMFGLLKIIANKSRGTY